MKKFNRKIALGLLTMLLMLAIIVVSSFWPFILDPERIMTMQFLSDELIIIAITIASTISMMFISQSSNSQNDKSEIARAKVEFFYSIKKIENRTAFFQWVKKVLQVKDRIDIAEQEMEKIDVKFDVYNLTDVEIKSLVVAQSIDNQFYKALTKSQIRAVLSIKKKVKALKFVAPNYYTSCKSVSTKKNLSQIASNENRKKIFKVVFDLTLKICMTVIGACIFGSLVRDLAQEGGSTAQAWMTFLSRMFAFITSSFLGYRIGIETNDLDAYYIMKRVEVHNLYLEDKTFQPVDEDREAFISRVANEQILQLENNNGRRE